VAGIGCPPSSDGITSPSSWMNAETFLQWMIHFIHHTGCGVVKQVLLILDNHESCDCLELARRNGVTMLTLPSHCSHKLQPLDQPVSGPFKPYDNAACDEWVVEKTKPMQTTDSFPWWSLMSSGIYSIKHYTRLCCIWNSANECRYIP